jgi:hypothetical protein
MMEKQTQASTGLTAEMDTEKVHSAGRKAYVAPRLAAHGNLEDMVASPEENGSPRGIAVVAGYRTF